tara:strand:- start:950 stop:1180 length:231 start_codon:yes stop_codon:yes gene_type:complete
MSIWILYYIKIGKYVGQIKSKKEDASSVYSLSKVQGQLQKMKKDSKRQKVIGVYITNAYFVVYIIIIAVEDYFFFK